MTFFNDCQLTESICDIKKFRLLKCCEPVMFIKKTSIECLLEEMMR